MLRSIEILVFEFLRWYYQAPWGVAFLAIALALVLLGYQYVNKDKTFLPGAIGVAIIFSELFSRLVAPRAVNNWLEALIFFLRNPTATVAELPFFLRWLEGPFSLFVAPLHERYYLEEGLFVGFLVYLGWVLYVSIQSYQKTGLVVGTLKLSALKSDQTPRPKRSATNELGSGDLAAIEAISRWTKPSGKAGDTHLPLTEVRGATGIVFPETDLILPPGERNRHILTISKTGGGKTTKLILPILYNDCLCRERSTIVIDSKPEMWRKLAGMTRKYNPEKRILLFNPLDRARSLSWNILAKIEDDTDCKLIATTLIMATDVPSAKSDSPFFRNNAQAILNAIMVGLMRDPNDRLSMPRIHELVQSGMKPLCDWLEAHPEAYRTSRTFVELARSGSQNADTIMSELGMRLSAWDLKAIRATTAFDELDIEDLVKYPTLFVVEFRESELEMLRPMANVIVIELLRFLAKQAEHFPGATLPRPVSLVIDEFASALGRLPDIHVKLNTLRSRNVSIVAAIQSTSQVKANYSDDADSVLAGFGTKIFMPPLDYQDAEWGSKESGQMTIRFQTLSSGSNRSIKEWFASSNKGTQEQVQQRAVLTPEEIGRPQDNRCTVYLPSTAPFQCHLVPFYKIPKMLKRISEFDSEEGELRIREKPIEYTETLPSPAPSAEQSAAAPGLPPGISNTVGWTDEQLLQKLEELKKTKLDWENTTGSARKWWEAFEGENKHRNALVLRLAEELAVRNATINEFFLAYVYSNTDNIQANLHYLDYTRLKKEEEERRKAAEQAAA